MSEEKEPQSKAKLLTLFFLWEVLSLFIGLFIFFMILGGTWIVYTTN